LFWEGIFSISVDLSNVMTGSSCDESIDSLDVEKGPSDVFIGNFFFSYSFHSYPQDVTYG